MKNSPCQKTKQTEIIFFGTSEFAVPVLELLVKNGWPVKLVITRPDQPIGRHQKLQPPPIKLAAKKLGLKIIQPLKLKNSEFEIQSSKFRVRSSDLFIVCAYGQFLPAKLLKIPQYGALNIHPSLLPKYRGPSPIQTAILNGEKETGVSIMLLDEEMDHGPILAQRIVPIGENEASPELSERLAQAGAELLLKTLPDYLSGKIKPQPQNHSQATFTKLLAREDGKIDWSRPAQEIYNQWRAFHPWPGLYTILSWRAKRSHPVQSRDCFGLRPRNDTQKNQPDLRIKLIEINPPIKDSEQNIIPPLSGGVRGGLLGQFVKIKAPLEKARGLGMVCGDGQILPIALLQPEGKKEMNAAEFINGYGRQFIF